MRRAAAEIGTLTAAGVIASLRLYFTAPRWAFLEQVAEGTGWGSGPRRWIDALAISLWPSQGLEAQAIEVKVSRNDWRREFKNPAKADEIGKRCHRFWIAAPVGVVPVDDLPPAWGLIEATSPTAAPRIVKQADRIGDPEASWPFLCAILRRAGEADTLRAGSFVAADVMESTIEAEVAKRVPGEVAAKTADLSADLLVLRRDHESLRAAVSAFESASGVKIANYIGPSIGEAVAAVRAAGGAESALANMLELTKRLRSIADNVEHSINGANARGR